MRWNLAVTVGLLSVCIVSATPTRQQAAEEVDSVEQQLIRHHHSTAADKSEQEADDRQVEDSLEEDDLSAVKELEEVQSNSDDDEETTVSEDELYDITVGDVIRDVLLTLRDHPEIVRELIASEKEKLAAQIQAFNSLVESRDSTGDTLAGFLSPGEQPNEVPKALENSIDRSGAPVFPQRQIEEKRMEEVANGAYTPDDSDDSKEFQKFLQDPQEGGKDDPMFNYEKVDSVSADPHNTQSHVTDVNSSQEIPSQSSDTEKVLKESRMPYRFPFLNPFRMLRQYQNVRGTSEESRTSDNKDHVTDEIKVIPSKTSEQSDKEEKTA